MLVTHKDLRLLSWYANFTLKSNDNSTQSYLYFQYCKPRTVSLIRIYDCTQNSLIMPNLLLYFCIETWESIVWSRQDFESILLVPSIPENLRARGGPEKAKELCTGRKTGAELQLVSVKSKSLKQIYTVHIYMYKAQSTSTSVQATTITYSPELDFIKQGPLIKSWYNYWHLVLFRSSLGYTLS